MFRWLIELITPVNCLGCGHEGAYLCAECAGAVTIPVLACFNCGRLTADGRACAACRRTRSLNGAIAAAHYEGAVRELILQLKFNRARSGVEPAAALICRALPAKVLEHLDGITAVPVAPDRRRERGYNQAELLAKAVARRLHVPYRASLRRRGSTHQLGAGRADRFAQVERVFEATGPFLGYWLIIDDIMTTGATLDACAAVLRRAGVKQVIGAVVAGQRG